MTPIKERLIGAITVMDNADAEKIWKFILHEFNNKNLWDSIEEDEPTDEEAEIMKAYEDGNEKYQPAITHDKLLKELGL